MWTESLGGRCSGAWIGGGAGGGARVGALVGCAGSGAAAELGAALGGGGALEAGAVGGGAVGGDALEAGAVGRAAGGVGRGAAVGGSNDAEGSGVGDGGAVGVEGAVGAGLTASGTAGMLWAPGVCVVQYARPPPPQRPSTSASVKMTLRLRVLTGAVLGIVVDPRPNPAGTSMTAARDSFRDDPKPDRVEPAVRRRLDLQARLFAASALRRSVGRVASHPSYPADHEPTIDVRPAQGRFDAFATVVGPRRQGVGACWCTAYRDSGVPTAERPQFMAQQCGTEPGPGVLVFVDGEVAGWCSIAPRSSYRRLLNSRTIPIVDDADAWCAVCFVVRPGYRKHGLLGILLRGAVEHAAGHGAEVVEGYPVDAGSGRVDVISGYVGSVRLFEGAGFTKAAETTGQSGGKPRWVMRKRIRVASRREQSTDTT